MEVAALLFGVTVFILTLLYLEYLRLQNYWLDRNVLCEQPHPVMGSLTFLSKINPGTWMRKMYSEYKSSYLGIWLFWRPALIVNSPEIARKILSTDSSVFKDRFASCSSNDHIGKLSLFNAKEPEWGNLRRRLTVPLSEVRLRAMDDFVLSKAKELQQRIKKEQDNPVDITELYADFATDIIGTTTLGVPCNATLTGQNPLRSINKNFGDFSSWGGLPWCCIFFFPKLANIFGSKLFSKSATDYVRKIIKPVIAEREANNEHTKGKDLLDALVKIKNNNEVKDPAYLENLVVASAATFLSGIITSGSILAHATYELAHHPELQEKLFQELLGAKQKYGNENFNSESLSQLTYLNCIIKEALRKYPTVSWLDRVASVDYKIDDDLTIQAGTPVYINGIGMHFDKHYFPDPNKFDPNRFLPENEAKIVPYSYLPFGEGLRMCIGSKFAMTIVRNALASVFLNYKVEPVSGAPKPQDIEIAASTIFYVPSRPLQVKFISRT
ncbi:unnamed protein product, partial [Brenthis ino]